MTIEKGRSTFPCPACNEVVKYLSKFKVSAFVMADFIQNDGLEEMLAQQGYQTSPAFTCPKCQVALEMHYQITLVKVVQVDGMAETQQFSNTSPQINSLGFTDGEVKLVELCKGNGLLEVFTQVAKEQMLGKNQPPTYMDRYLVTFLRTAQRKILPEPMLREFAREFPGRIEFWKAQGIGMILSDGKICRFVPMRSMNLGGEKRTERLEVLGVGLIRDKENFEYLKRTNIGYVPPTARIFLESLRHATGDHGRTMKSIPLRPRK